MTAAVAVGRSVGVDVQLPVAGSARRLARRCLGARASLLAGLPSAVADEEVAWVWSVQEAGAKVAGRGLECRPWTFPVAPVCPAGTLPGVRWRQLRGSAALPLSCAWSA
ncbi:hypothetical protein GCM10022222_64020 [Amycolatopsis ultiminotia]|uniref:4'-phosphopantetheinyl transferase n=1 Tax=Amycolatopsis ultiminotia TaxID=543629 RepID=A0ABP6XRL5_9PSEU